MDGYRDDREALRLRLDELERELARVQRADERKKLEHELGIIAERVKEARARIDQDRLEIGQLAAAIARMLPAAATPSMKSLSEEGSTPPEDVSRGSGTLTVGGITLGAVGLLVALVVATTTSPCSKQGGDGQGAIAADDLGGFPHAVDPSAAVTDARKRGGFGGEWQLASIRVRYATDDGRVDLQHPKYLAAIRYDFVEPKAPAAPPADSSVPLGVPVAPPATPRAGAIELTRNGWQIDAFAGVMAATSPVPVAGPECTIGEVWAAARRAGAPSGAVAVIEYGPADPSLLPAAAAKADAAPQRGQWSFTIEGTSFARVVADPGCTVPEGPPP